MLHKGPEPEKLRKRVNHLVDNYVTLRVKAVNEDRIKLIKLIESFQDEKEMKYSHPVVLGMCTHALIKVGGGLNLLQVSSKENSSSMMYRMLPSYGSKLGELLQSALDITPSNPLDDQQALVYLSDLYYHLDQSVKRSEGKKIQHYDELKNEVKTSLSVVLSSLTLKRPTEKALTHSLHHLADKYKTMGGVSPQREQYLQFMSGVNRHLAEHHAEGKECVDAYALKFGLALFLMEKIEKEYTYISPKGGYFSKGSLLYQCCQSAINVQTDSREVPELLKKKYYVALLSYVLNINVMPGEMDKWEGMGFKGAKDFFERLQNELAEKVVGLIRISSPNALSLSYLDIISSTAASYGVNVALGKLAIELSLRGSALSYFNLLKPEAVLLITLLAFACKSIVAQKATDAVNSIIVNTVSQPVVLTFSSIKKLGEYFTYHPKARSKDLVDNADFLAALAKLPEDIFTPILQEKMAMLVSYQPEKSSSKSLAPALAKHY